MHDEPGDKARTMVVLQNPPHDPTLQPGTYKFYFLAKTWKRRKGFGGDIIAFNTTGPYIEGPGMGPGMGPVPWFFSENSAICGQAGQKFTQGVIVDHFHTTKDQKY